jgi:Glycosyl transferase family 2
MPTAGSSRRSPARRCALADALTILVAARDEEDRIGATVRSLRRSFPEAEVLVADDGSRDATAELAEGAGARVLRLPARGKGQALSLAEREAAPGRLLLCDADVSGDLSPLLSVDADLAVAAFAQRRGGGFGIAKRLTRSLIRWRCGLEAREPLSGQRALSVRARAHCFPCAAGFGCEVRLTIDAVRSGLGVQELELPLAHRPTGRNPAGFAHRGRQLLDALLACGPLGTNHRGLRLPLVGIVAALGGLCARRRVAAAVTGIALVGIGDDVWSGPERGFQAHLRARRTTGVVKLVGIPALALAGARSLSGALLVALAANGVNLLDTRPGRALKAFLAVSLALRAQTVPYAGIAVLLLPYDLREMTMLGDAGSNALGAVLGFGSVTKLTGRGRWLAIAGLTAFTVLGETRSLGSLIERTPGLAHLDRLGRQP